MNYSFVFVAAMVLGARLRGGVSREERSVHGLWRANFGDGAGKRCAAAFAGRFIVPYGVRLAGGGTSGHMMSGMMMYRKDAWVFIAGGQLGAAAYMVTYPAWKTSGLPDHIAGGEVTLGTVPGSKFDGILAVQGDILGILLGLAFVVIAFVLPDCVACERKGTLRVTPAE